MDIHCMHCDKKIPNYTTICPHCGTKIGGMDPPDDDKSFHCLYCKKKLPKGFDVCPSCGTPVGDIKPYKPPEPKESSEQNGNTKKKPSVWFYVLVAVIIILVINNISSRNKESVKEAETTITIMTTTNKATEIVTTKESTQQDTTAKGLDAAAFESAAKLAIDLMNEASEKVIGKVVTSVYGSTAYVELYLADNGYWIVSDVTKKEFINTMGNLMDGAALSVAPDIAPGVETQILSQYGVLLGKRTMFGNVKLYE